MPIANPGLVYIFIYICISALDLLHMYKTSSFHVCTCVHLITSSTILFLVLQIYWKKPLVPNFLIFLWNERHFLKSGLALGWVERPWVLSQTRNKHCLLNAVQNFVCVKCKMSRIIINKFWDHCLMISKACWLGIFRSQTNPFLDYSSITTLGALTVDKVLSGGDWGIRSTIQPLTIEVYYVH